MDITVTEAGLNAINDKKNLSLLDRKKVFKLNLFWTGVIIYTTCATVSTAIIAKTHTNYSVFQALELIAIGLFIIGAFGLIKFKIDNKYLRFFYPLYIIWSLITISRGFVFDTEVIKDFLFNGPFGLFPYLAPLILSFPQNLLFYKRAFSTIGFLNIVYVVLCVVFVKDLFTRNILNEASQTIIDYLTKNLVLSCGILFIIYSYYSQRKNYGTLLVIILSVLLVIIRARRAMIIILSAPLIAAYIIYIFKSKMKIGLVIVSALGALIIITIGIKAYQQSSIFDSVKTRGLENSRSPVEDCFYSDMKFKDWVIGRGVNGKYYCPNIDINLKSDFRPIIETDYLNIILKGGLVSLGLLLFIMVPAILKGLFYSKNILSKAAAIWILFYLASLYPANVTTFTMSYLMVWISVGICYNKNIRNMPDELIKHFFLKIAI